MAPEIASTIQHLSPMQPRGELRRPVLVCAFPQPVAFALPESATTLGRGWLAERGIVDSEVSGSHLRVERAGGLLRVADAGSRNGTWINGARLSARDLVPLDDGAVLRIGRTLLVFRNEFEGALEPDPPLNGLVGPFGLRSVASFAAGLARDQVSTVLIEGETGVGKELVAHALAIALGRQNPFAAINMAGVAHTVFESQMFGHVAGAFSGAKGANPGILVAHEGGTVFLDEIGELDLGLQPKLLRLLENREVLPVGGQRPVRVDVAVIAATNRDLAHMVEAATFRRDLFARLAMARVRVPPLRERCEDLFGVACELAQRAGSALPADHVEVEAVERLLLRQWPNNVRELDAVLGAIRRLDPEPGLRLWTLEEVLGKEAPLRPPLTEDVVAAAMAAAKGNVTAAAAALGISRGKLLRFRKRTQADE